MSLTSNANFTLRRNIWIVASDAAVGQFYTFTSRARPWPNDNNPPALDNSVNLLERQIHNEMIFGKFVPQSGLSLMTKRYDWTADTVYDMYDDQDPDLFNKKFFVLAQESGAYHVFKCLNNNGGFPSQYQPLLSETAADDVYYSTADGYQWKYLYSFDVNTYNTFATPSYIPVTPNTAVTSNAVNGSIETYMIESSGGNYNSYTNGYFTEVAVGGNTQFFGIQGSDTTILSISPNTFSIGETVTQAYAGTLANGTVASQSSNSTVSFLTLRNVNGIFSAGANTITGVESGKLATVYDESSPEVSSNNNFYNGCSIYISSGTGAGQVGQISQYVVVGNARRVLLSNSFPVTPDFTSRYIISPRVSINGDGTGASALSIIDPTTKRLKDIRVISGGSGYTYANVQIFGNTGSTSLASNNAVVRPILSPRGGHGADLYSELSSTFLCYSSKFSNTESGKIPGTGSTYRRVGILTNPLYANVSLKYTYTVDPSFPIASGVTVTGSVSGATGTLNDVDSLANTINLTAVSGIFTSGDVLTAKYSNGSVAVPASSNAVVDTVSGQSNVFDARTCLVCASSTLTGGTFEVNDEIVQTEAGIDTAYGLVQDVQTSGSNTYIYLTEVKGNFQASDIGTSTYKYIYDDATRQVRIEVDEIIQPDLIPYTGEILYVENIEPVTRNSLQSETVKLILGFN